jgi:hypothetical protein
MLNAPDQFIPLAAGQSFFVKAQSDLLNNLLGVAGYEVRDGNVVFTENITATLGVNYVDMHLIVMDAGKYSDFDILPLPADLAAKIVVDAFNILKQQLPADKKVESLSEENLVR